MLLRFNNEFFCILFVSNTWRDPYYFTLKICLSIFHWSQISEKILLRLNNMFFRTSFVSDISEEPCYFPLTICFSLFHLFQIAGKNHPANIHFGEDAFVKTSSVYHFLSYKMSWKCLFSNLVGLELWKKPYYFTLLSVYA